MNFTRPTKGFTCVSNALILSPNLTSLELKCLVVVQSLPDNFRFNVKNILRFFGECQESVYSAFRSLEGKGYLKKFRLYTGAMFYQFTDCPEIIASQVVDNVCKKPNAEKPNQAFPHSNTGNTNTPDKNNNNNRFFLKTKEIKQRSISKNETAKDFVENPEYPYFIKAVSPEDQVTAFRAELNAYRLQNPGLFPDGLYYEVFAYYGVINAGEKYILRYTMGNWNLPVALRKWWNRTPYMVQVAWRKSQKPPQNQNL